MNQTEMRGRYLYWILSFFAAFLLFLIQPLIGKLLLPLFGGVAAVWIINLVFFTGFLLLGYLYAHYLILKLSPKWQVGVHFTVLLVASIFVLFGFPEFQNVMPDLERRVLDNTDVPVATLLAILFQTIGLPYFILATTSPIIQAWYGRMTGEEPYKLYSLSNAGSLLAIVAYPFFIEPFMGVLFQASVWRIGFIAFIILLYAVGILFIRDAYRRHVNEKTASDTQRNSTLVQKLTWIGLAMIPAMMLLTVTTRITNGIAAVPFLWLLPLAVYLISFIICFSSRHNIHPKVYAFLFLCFVYILYFVRGMSIHFSLILFMEILVFTASAMFCHTKLYKTRPELEDLTLYYLCVSIGGSAGTILIGLVAPVLFNAYHEYLIIIIGMAIFATYSLQEEISSIYRTLLRKWRLFGAFIILFLVVILFRMFTFENKTVIYKDRNFFGTLHVFENGNFRRLMNGAILHGTQYIDEERQSTPTTYYSEDSGVGLLLRAKKEQHQAPLRVGVVGLGAGTIAAYCEEGDMYGFYEINHSVVDIAEKYFTFLTGCRERGGDVSIKIGDARLVLARELLQDNRNVYDVLILDAFSDDAIPMHLLTKEVMNIYFKHLAQNGILAVHISNRYLDLQPVLRAYSQNKRLLYDAVVENTKNMNTEGISSTWVLLSRDEYFLKNTFPGQFDALDNVKQIPLWTDRYNNLLRVIK